MRSFLFKPRFNRFDVAVMTIITALALQGSLWWMLVLIPATIISLIGEGCRC